MSAGLPLRLDDRPVIGIYRSPLFNASETFVQSHAEALVRFQPLMIGLEDKGHVRPALAGRRLLPRDRREQAAMKLSGSVAGFAGRLRPHRPRLIHAHFAPDGLLALPLAERLGVPLVTTLHGYDVSRSAASLLFSGRLSWMRYALFRHRLAARGRLFLAVCEAVRRRAVARGFPPERTLTHHNGVDLDRFGPGGNEPEPGLVLHVGRLVEKKGTGLLLRAFRCVLRERPEARLAIAGDGPLRASLERQSAGLGGSVRFLGALGHAETADWMRRAWLLAAPSITARDGDSEGLPQVVIEAAASGLPAVASDHAGIPEAVEDGRTGFLVAEGDVDALARRLLDLLGSLELRLGMGAAARALAEERFDSVRQSRRLESLYDSLSSGDRQTRS
jgi:glycosyltransferase involved in cell wall biosynthesis